MKRLATSLTIAILGGLMSPQVQADIIEREFTQPGGKGAASGIVFQGSRNMRNLGKKRGTVSSVVVPSLNPVTVIPALENETLRPKPRFGYGSDYRPEAERSQSALAQKNPEPAASTPVYLFHYSYPVYRDYFIRSPYARYYSPFGSCWNRSWSGYSGISRFSLSFGW